MTLKAIAESVTKKEIGSTQKYLIFELIITDNETEEEIDIPYLRLKLFQTIPVQFVTVILLEP